MWLVTSTVRTFSAYRLQRKSFFGRHLERYNQLLNADKAEALIFHMLHMPFVLEMSAATVRMNDTVEVFHPDPQCRAVIMYAGGPIKHHRI